MGTKILTLDIEIYDEWGKNRAGADIWPQAKYLVHGSDDVLWTNDIETVLSCLRGELLRQAAMDDFAANTTPGGTWIERSDDE